MHPVPLTGASWPRLVPALAVLAVAGLLPACGDDGGGSRDAVVIADLAFSIPSGLDAGATVTVENDDSTTHTFTADGGEFDTGNIAGGESTEITLPAEPGDYDVHCEIHPSMSGTVTVA
jgi:plastocyanin